MQRQCSHLGLVDAGEAEDLELGCAGVDNGGLLTTPRCGEGHNVSEDTTNHNSR